jgi:hypothetical protein
MTWHILQSQNWLDPCSMPPHGFCCLLLLDARHAQDGALLALGAAPMVENSVSVAAVCQAIWGRKRMGVKAYFDAGTVEPD